MQPNTLVEDAPITYPPIGGVTRYTRDTDYWSPHNYDSGSSGTMTIRRALEMSKNLVTARLLDGGIKDDPAASLDEICRLAIEAGVYPKCERYYPFVLGAQPVRPIDLAGFYAAIANEGKRPTPHVIEQITQDGREIYKADEGLRRLGPVDPAAVFQLRTFLQGVVARGTAARMSALSQYIGGKTGTSDDFNDAWFAGFSNDVTIVVWVGYDNAKGKRTLGNGQAGGKVALPIFEHDHARRRGRNVRAADAAAAAVAGGRAPSGRAADRPQQRPAARRQRGGWRPTDRFDVRGAGGRVANVSGGFMEYFRLDDRGHIERHPGPAGRRAARCSAVGGGRRSVPGFQSWFGQPAGSNGFEASRAAIRSAAAATGERPPAAVLRRPPAQAPAASAHRRPPAISVPADRRNGRVDRQASEQTRNDCSGEDA